MVYHRSRSGGSRGFARATGARAQNVARRAHRAGNAGPISRRGVQRIARENARHVTTGRALVPVPVRTYNNRHTQVIVYSNGGTTTRPHVGAVVNRTPQVRNRGVARAANYRMLNERNQAYVGMTRGAFAHGRDVLNGPRIQQHRAGNGSAVTSEDRRHHVDVINLHATPQQARQGETRLYHASRETHGDSTRGAGNTARRSLS